MTTVHFVYPHGPQVSTPHAIGRKVGERLRERYGYELVHYDWDEVDAIEPGPDDVLLGHPHPMPGTIFRRSATRPGWRRVIALSPYCHGDERLNAFFDRIAGDCDLYLAITGNYWFSTVGLSGYSHWLPKMAHVDLAVDRTDFPPIRTRFNEPGQRRFLYIGNTLWYKNTAYLSKIARAMPEAEVSWIGSGRPGIPGVTPLGFQDFALEGAKRLLAEHDFFITVGNADANPTTILEAMARGQIPVCTPQSGYAGYPGIQNIPLNDTATAVKTLRSLQEAPEQRLREYQDINWRMLDEYFNWDRFTGQIVAAMESGASPKLERISRKRRARIRLAEVRALFISSTHLRNLAVAPVRRRLKQLLR